jgi:hypothetical protein
MKTTPSWAVSKSWLYDWIDRAEKVYWSYGINDRIVGDDIDRIFFNIYQEVKYLVEEN